MTVTLELAGDVEEAIGRKAARLGITPSEYLGLLAERAAKPARTSARPSKTKPSNDRPRTGAEALAELKALDIPKGYGDPAIDAPQLARQLSARFSRPNREAAE